MLDVAAYTIIAEWFPRLLGIIYFFTFGAFALQIKGLIGQNGILPAGPFLKHIYRLWGSKAYWRLPTLFWITPTNKALMGVTVGGSILSLCLLGGFFPPLMLVLLYVFYLSIVSAGQEFLGFGWEGFLLEITINTFLLSLSPLPNAMVWISLNFLLFRFHVQAGAVKLQSRDPNWRNQSAIAYHYQTQPLPNTVAWYFYKLPLWFHQVSCVFMFFAELIAPFGIFFGQSIRLVTFTFLAGLQLFIWGTGNLSFLNHLTFVLCLILLNNNTLEMLGMTAPEITPPPLWLDIALTIAGSALIALQIIRFYHHFFPLRLFAKILNPLAPYFIANRYGIFAVMTTERYEIVIEGSDDGLEWKEYTFRHKPSEITRRPKRVSPYQPRLDWQAWFLPFSEFGSERWFQEFLSHILRGTPDVLSLLGYNPFPEKPPHFVRAVIYEYIFSTSEEKKKWGWWWRRTFVGAYTPVLSLKKMIH